MKTIVETIKSCDPATMTLGLLLAAGVCAFAVLAISVITLW